MQVLLVAVLAVQVRNHQLVALLRSHLLAVQQKNHQLAVQLRSRINS